MKEEIILHFIHCQVQIRLAHWQTDLDAKHRALGSLYEFLVEAVDEFVETMLGKYGRPQFEDTMSIGLDNPKSLNMESYLSQFKDFLFSLTNQLDPVQDTDLLNMRDEILGKVNHTLYLLTLKY